MNRSTFSILFFIKRKKLLKSGEAPVYMRITINGKSNETSLKRSILPNLWDTNRNKAKGKSAEATELNEYLTSVRGQLFVHQRNLQESGKHVTPKMLSNAFAGIGEKQWTLMELFEEHNKNMEQLIGKEYSPLTLQRFKASMNHLKEFSKMQYNNENLLLTEINNQFITGFEFYLKTKAMCQHNSAMKHIKALKKVIRIALANDYIRKDPFASFKITQKPVDRICLTEKELDILVQKEMPIERLSIIRDLFVFQCYSGLAYKDLKSLEADDIQIGMDRNNWIIKKRGKTDNTFRVPLLPITEAIIEKYKDHPIVLKSGKLLPVPSNQKMNAYLKEVATICKINKDLHTHLARHTYATTVTLSNGVPIETVSKLLGHSKLQTTQIYAKVLDTKISEEFESLRNKLAM